jgi:hypothetical protein
MDLPPDLLAMMNQVSNIAATGDDDEAREEAYNVLASMLLGQVDASSGPTVPTSHLPASPPPTATLPLTSNLLATQVTAEQPLPLVPSELATVETPCTYHRCRWPTQRLTVLRIHSEETILNLNRNFLIIACVRTERVKHSYPVRLCKLFSRPATSRNQPSNHESIFVNGGRVVHRSSNPNKL